MPTRAWAVVVVAGLLAACGGGGSTGTVLTQAQLVAKVNAECQKLASAGNDLVSAQDPASQGAQVARYMHDAAAQLRRHVANIGALVPPPARAGDMSRFVSILDTYADQLDALANRTKTGETYEALLSRSTSQVNSLNRLGDQANGIAAKLGFKDCAT